MGGSNRGHASAAEGHLYAAYLRGALPSRPATLSRTIPHQCRWPPAAVGTPFPQRRGRLWLCLRVGGAWPNATTALCTHARASPACLPVRRDTRSGLV